MPIFYSALLLTGVNLLLRLATTSFQVYISGRIGAAGVGLLQLVMSVSMLARTAGIAGIRTTAMYLAAEELGRRRSGAIRRILSGCFLYSIMCSGAVSLLLYFGAPFLAERWIGDLRTVASLRLFACFLPVTCLGGVMTGYFTAANRIATLSAVEIAEQLCSMAVTLTALSCWAGGDPARACEAVILGGGAGAYLTLFSLLFLRRRERAVPAQRTKVARRLLRIAVPLALADDLKAGLSTAENLIVPQRLALYTAVAEPLAAFGIVSGMVFPILMFPSAILFALSELLIPELARCAAAGSARRIRYLTRRSLRVSMLYGLCCGGLLFLFADPLCEMLYHSGEAGSCLRRFAFLAPMLYCDIVTDAATKGLGQQQYCVLYNILTSALDIALLYLLLPVWGMEGYFFSFLLTHLLNFLLSIRRLLRVTGLSLPLRVPLLAMAAALLAVSAAAQFPTAALRAAVFLAMTVCLCFLFGILRREDLHWLRGLVRPGKRCT
ncbi:MAG: polysaccharide biosynthesis C-terminal domain-containing protein [Oscillospiraceae bacterium]